MLMVRGTEQLRQIDGMVPMAFDEFVCALGKMESLQGTQTQLFPGFSGREVSPSSKDAPSSVVLLMLGTYIPNHITVIKEWHNI